MNPVSGNKKAWQGALGFLTWHVLLLLVLQLALGGLFMLYEHGNEFAGVSLVIAFYTAPIPLLVSLPIWLVLYFKSAWPHSLALLVSLLAVLMLQLFLRSAPPPGVVNARGVTSMGCAHV